MSVPAPQRRFPCQRLRDAARLWRLARRDPRLGWLLLDNLITTFGASFTLIALPFLVMRLTGHALDLGLTAALEALPSLAFLFFFRGFLDRADPAKVLWICRALYVVLNAVLAVATWFGAMTIELIYLLALIGGLVWAVAYPAGRACFGLYIRKGLLPAGNAVFAVASSLATMALPMLAGGLILASDGERGLAVAFAIDAVCVALSLPLIAAVRRRGPVRKRETASEAGTHAAAAIDTGPDPAPLAAGATIPRSYYAYLLASTVLVFGPVQILLPVLLVQRHDSRYLSIYIAQFAGIFIAAGLSAPGVPPALAAVLRKIVLCWSVAALAYGLLGWSAMSGAAAAAQLPAALLAFGVLAGASNYYGIQSLSWLQRSADAHSMGREMTWFSAATMGAMPLATLLTGALIDRLHWAQTAQALAAAILAVALLALLHLPGLRQKKAPGTRVPGAV
ncbi:MFS transporter [Lysobacter sp. CA199]|uniref:MFS transporter n=1 Tax=Lysobacter sp. CA199 TaxID=3455608 RepID=UPI003F8CF715